MPYISVTRTVDTGEGFQEVSVIVWVDGPVEPGTDTYLPVDAGETTTFVKQPAPQPAPPPPAPPPASSIDRAPAPVPAPAAPPPPINYPAVEPGSATASLQQQIKNLKTDAELQAYLATTKASAAELAAASGFSTADVQAAIDRAKTQSSANKVPAAVPPPPRPSIFSTKDGYKNDPEISKIDLKAYETDRNAAFEKLAIELYGGRDMTFQDILRLENAVGATGYFQRRDNGLYYLDKQAYERVASIDKLNPLPGAVPTDKVRSGAVVIPTPVRFNPDGSPVYNYNDPAFFATEQIIRDARRAATQQVAKDYNLDFVITTAGEDGKVYLTLGNNRQIDISRYYAGIPPDPTYVDRAVPRQTVVVETGYLDRKVEIQKPLEQSVTVQLPSGQNIVVDPTSELARYIQYLGTQPRSDLQIPFAEVWAKNGVSDPYSDPATVQYAIEALERTKQRQDDLRAIGITPQESFWNDPNWPAYVGSSKEAFLEASRAINDPAYAAQLKAANNWSDADFQSWTRSILNPEEHGRQVAEAERARGIVAGPSSSGNGGTSNYALSSNSASVIERPINEFYANGAPVTNVTSVSNNTALNPGVDPSLNPSNIVSSIGSVATAALSGFASATAAAAAAQSLISGALTSPTALPSSLSPFVTATTDAFNSAVNTGLTTVENLFSGRAATLLLAKNQATLQARNNEAATADWRVRLQLGVEADYLYKDAEPGILAPLYDTDGVIFPYMPSIETSYAANYDKFDLTHSNYRGYFYKGSNVNDINLRATFTAQDTQEANYLLAVIHFFRSVTKMFYGQDSYRGAPPPLVFLNGLGNYQFNEHPCFVSNFSYSLPNDVDYIRALAPNNYGNLFSKRQRTGSAYGGIRSISEIRLGGIPVGAIPQIPTPGMIQNNVNNIDDATYVPTKMEINITLLPTNTRAQVSQQFSLKDFANGNLLKGGFW